MDTYRWPHSELAMSTGGSRSSFERSSAQGVVVEVPRTSPDDRTENLLSLQQRHPRTSIDSRGMRGEIDSRGMRGSQDYRITVGALLTPSNDNGLLRVESVQMGRQVCPHPCSSGHRNPTTLARLTLRRGDLIASASRHHVQKARSSRVLVSASLPGSADVSDAETEPGVRVGEEWVVLRLEADGGDPHLVGGAVRHAAV